MSGRMRVGVLYGGRSGEHEVSLRSASTIIAALDPQRYEVVPVAITKAGRWRTGIDSLRLLDESQRDLREIPEHGIEVTPTPDPTRAELIPVAGGVPPTSVDVVFPVLHGTYGEDGTVQGLLEMTGLPYVGAGVLASAVGMDKAAMKSAFRDAGLPVCRSLVARPLQESADAIAARIADAFGYPCFVKPANLGSSVGISKVDDAGALPVALAEAVAWDPKLIIEEAIAAREFECGVIGNDAPEASVVGELIPSRDFYDYVDKYVADGARMVIPAALPSATADAMRRLAVETFRAVDCSGLARVDFFLETSSLRVLINEINTMPGFTPASMFPRLWAASGVPLPALLDRLIALALERHAARSRRRTSVTTEPSATVSATRRSSGGSR